MSKAVTSHRWFAGWRASPPAVDLHMDAADYGTAFGLDLSMAPVEHEAPTKAPPASRQPGWVRRLSARTKPLA